MKLSDLVRPGLIVELPPLDKQATLRHLAQVAAGDARVSDADALFDALLHRERQATTGIGLGLAIPHAKIPEISDNLVVIGRSREGIEFESVDGAPVHLIFMIGASDRQTREFVRLLAAVTHVLKDDALRARLLDAPIPDDFMNLLRGTEPGV
jgi:mannitol/fructose-specific phosphotransferase system IIA component (Ntr-type)